VQELLGHRDVSTTMIYTRLALSGRRHQGYDVTETAVEILAIVEKQDAQTWLDEKGTPTTGGGAG
jgi:integrase